VVLIHHHGAEATLPEMSRALLACVDVAGVAAMGRGKGASQPILVAGREDQLHRVGHQHPGPHLDLRRPAGRRQQIAVELGVFVTEEVSRATVAALGHVVRLTGNHETGKAGNDRFSQRELGLSISALSP
jgi:hypothetical protein